MKSQTAHTTFPSHANAEGTSSLRGKVCGEELALLKLMKRPTSRQAAQMEVAEDSPARHESEDVALAGSTTRTRNRSLSLRGCAIWELLSAAAEGESVRSSGTGNVVSLRAYQTTAFFLLRHCAPDRTGDYSIRFHVGESIEVFMESHEMGHGPSS